MDAILRGIGGYLFVFWKDDFFEKQVEVVSCHLFLFATCNVSTI